MKKFGMIRVACATPELKVANVDFNTQQIIKCLKTAERNDAGLVVFPELTFTGCTCGNLFFQSALYNMQLDGLKTFLKATTLSKAVAVAGIYIRLHGCLYSCAAIIKGGEILGLVPVMAGNGLDRRIFSKGSELPGSITTYSILNQEVPIGNLIFAAKDGNVRFTVEPWSDACLPLGVGRIMAMAGAQIVCCPGSDPECAGGVEGRRNRINALSSGLIACYAAAMPGAGESTTDKVYSGHQLVSENGRILAEGERFSRENTVTFADVDVEMLDYRRLMTAGAGLTAVSMVSTPGSGDMRSYTDSGSNPTWRRAGGIQYREIPLKLRMLNYGDDLFRTWSKKPFVPEEESRLAERCREIFEIQVAGLRGRMEYTHSEKLVLGVSGGLDSTLALLVCAEALRRSGKDHSNLIAVTMPGFGTTGRTYENALELMKLLGCDAREIPIAESVTQHFDSIGHDINLHDVTFENAQARERTQILMDIANSERGLQVGTGDLSEEALGWCTYGGDHMSMYNVNSTVPKTLMPCIIRRAAGDYVDKMLNLCGDEASAVNNEAESGTELMPGTITPENADAFMNILENIIETPVSPELLPPDTNGEIQQKTEDTIGPYILHDFFLYHTIRSGMSPEKLLYAATLAFKDDYDEDEIERWLWVFLKRFMSQQFKRSCSPDGATVGTVGLSPRGNWEMPSDVDASGWIKMLD